MYDQTNTVFALDIGTRTVMGLVVSDDERPKVLAADLVEHSSRAMEDGQVHDVEAVAKVVAQIRGNLSQKVGFPLDTAAVAAAGRSLLTYAAEVQKDIRAWGEISREDVNALELEAVQRAQEKIRRQQAGECVNTRYHCVGYSVNQYLLDDSPIKNLVGHRGTKVVCRVTATFLPEIVVDALYSVLRLAGLNARSMTLEPIAASTVVIPPDLRLLNLALVDMGAGTSDIAISRDGMITAYGMVPLAGDEVSEILEENFILDFATAEQVKRELAAAGEIQFTDVLGQSYVLPSSEIVEVIRPTLEEVGYRIAKEIIQLNGGTSPKAVICIGGASQTPKLREILSEALGLPLNRVAIRYGRDAVDLIQGDLSVLNGPDGVTPLGIALSAQGSSVLSFQSVDITVDDAPVRLFNLIAPTVADALLAADIDPVITRNRLGLALTVKVNGTFQAVKGTPGKAGLYMLNGQTASLETPVHDGDEVKIIPAVHGQDASATLGDLIPKLQDIEVVFNGKEITLRPKVYLNGQKASLNTKIKDGSDITFSENVTIRDILRAQGVSPDKGSFIKVTVNGRTRQFQRSSMGIRVNGTGADLDYRLKGGEYVDYSPSLHGVTIKEILSEMELKNFRAVEGITVNVNDDDVLLPGGSSRILQNGKEASLDTAIADGDDIQVVPGRHEAHFFAEVFNYIPLDIGDRPEGTRLVTLRNGIPAEYSTPLNDGDRLVIRWEKTNGVDSTTGAG